MEISLFETRYFPLLTEEMKTAVSATFGKDPLLTEILMYHFSWGSSQNSANSGKKMRPLLLFLTIEALGGDWHTGIGAACAVEFLHNYSLIHDDIEDKDEIRHGQATIWKRFGLANAINAGDALYGLAFKSISQSQAAGDPQILLKLATALSTAAVELSIGQSMDLSFEAKEAISPDVYWQMVKQKTSALFRAALEMGAILAHCDPFQLEGMTRFGEAFGMAFQAQDDLLGIWGVEKTTGKPIGRDLLNRKKTLPVCFALEHDPKFKTLIGKKDFGTEDTIKAISLLEGDGAHQYTIDQVQMWTEKATDALQGLQIHNDAMGCLERMTRDLSGRIK